MAEYTANYNLYKPNRADTDPVDTTLSANFQTIDTEMKRRETDVEAVKNDLVTKSTELQTQIDTKTFGLQEQIDSKTSDLQGQVDNLVIDGDSSPAIAQTLSGTPFETLREMIDFVDLQPIGSTEIVRDAEGRVLSVTTPLSTTTYQYLGEQVEKITVVQGGKTFESTFIYEGEEIKTINRVVI